MKKQIKNILIISIIIIGIVGAWVVKNRGANNEIIQNEEIKVENEIEQPNDIQIEKVEEVENIKDVVIEENKELEIVDDIAQEENKESEIAENIVEEENKEPEILEANNSEEVAKSIDKNDPNFELSTPSFDIETLTSYELPILLDFGAEWCGPCQRMHPILEELNSELRGKAIVKYVDIDKYKDATKDFDFTLIPTQYFINKDGEIYKTHTGIMPKEDVIGVLKEMGMEE